MQYIQIHFSQTNKGFWELFCAFFKSILYFQHFQKKITRIGYVFTKLRTQKDVVR